MSKRQFHCLEVVDVRRETERATSIAFAVPEALAQTFAFKAGQYLTLRAEIGGETLRRPYSVCVAPDSGELRICSKMIDGGRFSTYLNEGVKVGDRLEVMAPMGRFHAPIEADKAKRYVFLAGGSGITPVIANMRAILAGEPDSEIVLVYGNRTIADIIFREALCDLKDRHMERLQLFHVLSDEIPDQPLFAGMMDEAKVHELLSRLVPVGDVDWFFICGPGPMMDGARAALTRLGVDDDRIKIESFGERPQGSAATPTTQTTAVNGAAAEVEVIHNGVRKTIAVPFAGPAILDCATARRIDVPFACKGGVCCTCRAKLVEGEVEMDVVYGLEPDEIAAGYILTCQAHPRSKRLVVDYDG